MKLALLGNMNNNNFSIMRYLRDLGVDAHLLLFENDGVGSNSHFVPENDTWEYDKWKPYIHKINFSIDPALVQQKYSVLNIVYILQRIRLTIINRKFSKAYKPISNTKIENILKGYDAFIGSGLTGIMLMRIGPLTCIGHGVRLGKSCFVSQSVTIAGSVAIGNFVKIWGNDSIRDGILVGNGSTNWYGSRCSKKYSEK